MSLKSSNNKRKGIIILLFFLLYSLISILYTIVKNGTIAGSPVTLAFASLYFLILFTSKEKK
ncbi:hypothetical protein ACZ11_01825 [Lysinibacillus xylanilyticus]|uniref:Uncharacterized protein n=1 Tax=Lysinibacillus xylanilyticus TaxID=582475 RepID=A0A0K9FH10_9BACI|nr:hypothetical protein ACZ11_01825 [Lysinibacillus xylanilyticus]